jgi:uncharacterized protein YggT (Ycf19 family)
MLPEPYGGLLLGAILTLVVSVITMFLTNYFSQKNWRSQKDFEQRRETVEQLYSPLYFLLDDLVYPLGFLNGYLNAITAEKN